MVLVKEIDEVFSKYKCPHCDRDFTVTNGEQLIVGFDTHSEDNEDCRQFILGLNKVYTPFYLNNAGFKQVQEYLEQYATMK